MIRLIGRITLFAACIAALTWGLITAFSPLLKAPTDPFLNVVGIVHGHYYATGFMISPTTVVTVRHLFTGDEAMKETTTVFFGNGLTRLEPNEVVLTFGQHDLAILRLPTDNTAPAGFRMSETPAKIGDSVYMLTGYHGFTYRRKMTVIGGTMNLFLLLGPVTHGNSGSPVVNEQGEIVGMIIAYMDDHDDPPALVRPAVMLRLSPAEVR